MSPEKALTALAKRVLVLTGFFIERDTLRSNFVIAEQVWHCSLLDILAAPAVSSQGESAVENSMICINLDFSCPRK
jgi:hypothetical protein